MVRAAKNRMEERVAMSETAVCKLKKFISSHR